MCLSCSYTQVLAGAQPTEKESMVSSEGPVALVSMQNTDAPYAEQKTGNIETSGQRHSTHSQHSQHSQHRIIDGLAVSVDRHDRKGIKKLKTCDGGSPRLG